MYEVVIIVNESTSGVARVRRRGNRPEVIAALEHEICLFDF